MTLLIIQHADNCPPGRILDFAPDAQVLRMWETPDALHSLACGQIDLPSGIVILGGAANAYADTYWPWLPDVRALIRRAHEESVPLLGICLGMQLAGVGAGGTVTTAAPQGAELGLTQIFWNDTSEDPLVRALCADEWTYADHSDAVTETPADVSVLARSDKYIHVIRWGSVVGVQYHPEVTPEIVRGWLESTPPENPDEILHDYLDAEEELADHCQRLCHLVLGEK